MPKRHAMGLKQASFITRRGHSDFEPFAKLIGLEDNSKSDPHAKKM